MKKYLIIILSLLCWSSAKSQEKITNQVATVQLPKGSQKIALSNFESYGKKNFKRRIASAKGSNSFIVDNALLVSINELTVTAGTKRTLEKWKMQLEDVYRHTGSPWDVSKIETISNNRFFIFEDHKGDEYSISFYSEDIGDKKFSGSISFKEKDKEKAHQYLYNLLQDVKLKK